MASAFLPLDVVREMYAEETGDVLTLVVTIDDASFPAPLYLTDTPAQRLSNDPLRYGFRGLHDYAFAITAMQLPDLKPGSPLATTIVIDNIETDYVTPIVGATDPRVSYALVMGSAPTTLLRPVTGLFIVSRTYDEDSVTIGISNRRTQGHGGDNISDPLIRHRQTRSVAPGLFR